MIHNPQFAGCTLNTVQPFRRYLIPDIAEIFSGLGTYAENLIEFAGRACYRSTDRMGNAPDFIAARLREGHTDILEHGWLTLRGEIHDELAFLQNTAYLVADRCDDGAWLISGNFRAWLQSFRTERDVMLEAATAAPTIFTPGEKPFLLDAPGTTPVEPRHASRNIEGIDHPINAKVALLALHDPPLLRKLDGEKAAERADLHRSATFLVDGVSRACSHQFVRHRLGSFSQESQRYVDLVKGGWRPVIPPAILDSEEAAQTVKQTWEQIEQAYIKLRLLGIRKEDARFLLPNATETRFVVTMSMAGWKHFLSLRDDKAAQWEIRAVAATIRQVLHEAGLIEADHDEQT